MAAEPLFAEPVLKVLDTMTPAFPPARQTYSCRAIMAVMMQTQIRECNRFRQRFSRAVAGACGGRRGVERWCRRLLAA
jgi:hypothetical protein